MMKNINKADMIISFTETHLRQEYDPPIINSYQARQKSRIKGISIYCKENMNNTQIQEIVYQGGIIILATYKLTNLKWLKFETSFLIAKMRKIENRNSKLMIIMKELEFKMDDIIMMGDLNGRTGQLNAKEQFKMSQSKSYYA